ncbi:MAG: AAA family ATPase [Candidatus Paceibacterota bacterium]|jgi:hypothetical protein
MEYSNVFLNSEVHPNKSKRVKLIETHISKVYLTDKFVYKTKKPVDFGFCNFRALKKRKFYCEEEIRLNKRLCPELYLGIVPLYEIQGTKYEIIDYAVKMKRLPEKNLLANSLNILNENRVKKLAQIIAKFHKNNIEAPFNIKVNSFKNVKRNWQENFEQTKLFINSTINQKQFDFIRKRVESFILNKKDLFQKRIANHKIREGHGDLHTGNIFFYKNNFYIFDAIEFNERFRFEDITSDLAFILMDLEFHNYSDLSRIILNKYLSLTKDKELLLLINFYKCYRAYVRGKILSFQTKNQNLSLNQRKKIKITAKKYFALAHDYATQVFPKPIFLIMCGFTGSGKTHLSQLLNQRLGLKMIQSDVVLKKSVGLEPQTRKYLKFEQGIFSQKSRDKNYLRMVNLAEKNLKQNQGVVLDASFIYRRWRNLAEMMAENLNIPYLIVHCQVPKNIISERLKTRAKNDLVSDGRPYIYENQKKVFENFTKKEKVLRIDTTENFDKILRKILTVIKI